MNRIKLSPLAATTSDELPNTTLARDVSIAQDRSNRSLQHTTSLFVPLHYEPNYAYPLIVWLHDDGQQADRLQTVMAQVSMRNYVGVSPQAPVGNFEVGYFWEQDYDAIESANQSILDSIAMAQSRMNIAPNRVFLAGMGSGGTMAMRVALRHPERFAGVASLNGPFPEGCAPLAHWDDCRLMPLLWSHHLTEGEEEAWIGDQFRFLYSAGFLNLTVREYPSQDHLVQLGPAAIDQWIMEQIDSSVS